jgi:hypothetical protein
MHCPLHPPLPASRTGLYAQHTPDTAFSIPPQKHVDASRGGYTAMQPVVATWIRDTLHTPALPKSRPTRQEHLPAAPLHCTDTDPPSTQAPPTQWSPLLTSPPNHCSLPPLHTTSPPSIRCNTYMYVCLPRHLRGRAQFGTGAPHPREQHTATHTQPAQGAPAEVGDTDQHMPLGGDMNRHHGPKGHRPKDTCTRTLPGRVSTPQGG